ncbi:fucolectin-1-like [Gigantopelta aegis]|uniref:fucolectin-1-like n=1 Tax=Gigantopelta aegis TaxID=1735272 RepID=UPI001B88E61E|nr:fucolectin-1-like [Gigantopelta aegis]
MTLVCLYILVLLTIQTVKAVNLAAGKPATQSSAHRVHTTADKAVDGNADKAYSHGSCSHTNCQDRAPWWMVDLGKVYLIKSVTIAVADSASGRMRNFRIELYNKHPNKGGMAKLCASQGPAALAHGKDRTFTCSRPTRGRFVKISKKFTSHCDALILCEVMVNGEEVVNCPFSFVRHGRSCYFYSEHKAGNWFQARDICRALGADLAIADNKEKVKFFKSALKSLGALGGRIYYLGGHAFSGQAFRWLDSNALSMGVFDDWDKATNPKDPEPNIEDELCFGMHREHYYTWHNIHCSRREQFICEKSPMWPRP